MLARRRAVAQRRERSCASPHAAVYTGVTLRQQKTEFFRRGFYNIAGNFLWQKKNPRHPFGKIQTLTRWFDALQLIASRVVDGFVQTVSLNTGTDELRKEGRGGGGGGGKEGGRGDKANLSFD